MTTDAYAALLDDLRAEQQALVEAVRDLEPDDWLRPTPARGWDVRDTIAHLADTDELAIDTVVDGPRSLMVFSATLASAEDTTYWGVLRGRRLTGADVLAWWERTQAVERDTLAAIEPGTRVPWGLGMSATAFVTARLMECWAHSLDVHTALGTTPVDTDRLAHVAWIGVRALPYAFTVAGREPPATPLRVELTLPSGAVWAMGAEDAPDRITGLASEMCRILVQRLPRTAATSVRWEGDGADAALDVARSFL